MKRHKSLILLSKEHHSHLVYANRLVKGKPINKQSNCPGDKNIEDLLARTIEYFSIDMVNHFELEEKYVFPVYQQFVKEEKFIDLLQVILDEHKEVKRRIGRLNLLLDKKELITELKSIGKHIENHIRVEERKLFEDIQKIVPFDELIEIGKILKSKSKISCSHLL